MENALFFRSIYWHFPCSTNFFPFFLPLVSKKIQSTHFFYTFGYVWFSHFLFDFHETTRLSPISLHIPSLFSPFLRQYCGGLWCTFRLPYRGAEAEYFPFPKKPSL